MPVTKNKKSAPKKARTKKPTADQVLADLRKNIPQLVHNTVSRYQNGAYANIFNTADMTALADDTALEVRRRVVIGLKNPKHEDCVDLKGAASYFKRAFINQCLKLYEKHAKTDIRAGIQTVGSEEALAVAASKNLYSPEDSYIVNDQFKYIFDSLKEVDHEYNTMVKAVAERQNRPVEPAELQYFEEIIQLILEGYTAEESAESLKISNPEYLRQKRMVFEYIKQEYRDSLEDLMEHFASQEDYRVHVRDVNKRQKLKQEMKDYKPKTDFYIQTKITETKGVKHFVATLWGRIDMYDKYDNRTSKVASKTIALKEVKAKLEGVNMERVVSELKAQSKNEELKSILQEEANKYLEVVKNKKIA